MMPVLLKFVHIIAIAGWSAGLICLPFLYLQRRRLSGDALHKLHNFTRFFYVSIVSPAAFVAVGSGIALIFVESTFTPWFSLKLAFVGALVIVHVTSGTVILRLFEPDQIYPFWRFAAVSIITVAIVTAILVTVLGKPDFGPTAPFSNLFEPGALGVWLGDLTAWSR